MDTRIVTHPSRSVVVEACAGSGKTWLLTARVVRALLEGTPPAGILALTFTDKAAAEMRGRVRNALAALTRLEGPQLRQTLSEYGIEGQALERAMSSAPRAYEALLVADRQPTISTFHAWYAQLLSYSPSPVASLATLGLASHPGMAKAEAWVSFVASTAQDPSHPIGQLAQYMGLRALQSSIWASQEAWRVALLADAAGEDLLTAQSAAEQGLARWVAQTAPTAKGLAAFFAPLPRRAEHAQALSNWDQESARSLGALFLRDAPDGAERQIIKYQFVRKADRVAWAGHAGQVEEQLLELVSSLNAALEQADQRIQAARHRMLCRVALAWQDHWSGWVERTGETDYDGLEAAVVRLLKSDMGPVLLSRLDCRYEQILVDEFQDTNPIQWGLLRAWLDPHVGLSGPAADAPKVFIVGDPKQSIYRFRGADPRVFFAARDWLVSNFGAVCVETDTTRRCAGEIVGFMNQVCPDWGGSRYRLHHCHRPVRAGFVAYLAPPPEPCEQASASDEPRDWLLQPEHPRVNSAWVEEGRRIAQAILTIRGANPWLDWGQIRLLARGRTHMAAYESALSERGIPIQSDRRGGLLEQSEVQDILALCRWLSHPWSNADLAHVLRSPFFSCSDAALFDMAQAARQSGQTWWQVLAWPDRTTAEGPSLRAAAERLATWRGWMSTLPVHDLLDRILADAGLWLRLSAYGQQRVPQVQANIESLLALSLEWDAGRSPSVARFVQDMTTLIARADNEAPPVVQASLGPSAVHIQTLHSAKGLEAELIILAGLTDTGGHDQGIQWLTRWSSDRTELQQVSTWQEGDARAPEVTHARDEQSQLVQEETFNLFYVAVTRARRMLLLSCAKASESHWLALVSPHCEPWVGRAPALGPFEPKGPS